MVKRKYRIIYLFVKQKNSAFTTNDTSFNKTEDQSEMTLHAYLCDKNPDYIETVPNHWLSQDQPVPDIQTCTSIFLLVLCISGNISQLLVMSAFKR